MQHSDESELGLATKLMKYLNVEKGEKAGERIKKRRKRGIREKRDRSRQK